MVNVLSNNILTRAFWGDEAWTTLISALPFLDLIKTTAADFHPPLYYTIIHFWIMLFGNSEVSIRTVSLAFWFLSGVIAYSFSRSFRMSKTVSFLASLFILFNPFIFTYAFEARSYTLFVFLSLTSFWQFYRLLNSKKTGMFGVIGYLLITAVGMYTHYYMFFVVAAQYLFVLFFRRDLFSKFFKLGIVLGILYLPWLPFFLSQTKSVASGYWIPPISIDTIRDSAKVLVRGEQTFFLYQSLPIIYVLFLGTAVFFGLKHKRFIKAETAFLLLWFLVPFVTPIIISFIRPLFFYRYLIIATVPVMILPLYLIDNDWPKTRLHQKGNVLFLIPAFVLAIYFYSDWLAFRTHTNQLFKGVLAQIHSQKKAGDVIYTVLPSFAEVVYYNNYFGDPLPIKVLPQGLSQASGKALLDTYVAKRYVTLENFSQKGRYWYLTPGPKFVLSNR